MGFSFRFRKQDKHGIENIFLIHCQFFYKILYSVINSENELNMNLRVFIFSFSFIKLGKHGQFSNWISHSVSDS